MGRIRIRLLPISFLVFRIRQNEQDQADLDRQHCTNLEIHFFCTSTRNKVETEIPHPQQNGGGSDQRQGDN